MEDEALGCCVSFATTAGSLGLALEGAGDGRSVEDLFELFAARLMADNAAAPAAEVAF